jgi:hypothetical protein
MMNENYAAYGLTPQVAAWEDGLRSDPAGKTYEWWYTDCESSDGTRIVLIFFTKESFFTFQKPNPTVQLDLTLPDGTKIYKTFSEGQGRIIQASREKCDVSVGDCSLRQVGGTFEIHYQHENIRFHLVLKPSLPMWRPGTGYLSLGGGDFAWLVPVPSADMQGTLSVSGEIRKITGYGYHDHNWGNINMYLLLNQWYWCRARVAGYTIICSDMITVRKYGNTRLPIFMVARDGRVLAAPSTKTIVIRKDTAPHPVTGKTIENSLTFINRLRDGSEYKVKFQREADILAILTSTLKVSRLFKLWMKIQGQDPSYVRCVGRVQLTVTDPDGKQEVHEEKGLWEQMWFGANKVARIGENI